MWKGMVTLGLLNIPIKLYAATEARGGLAFNMLCPTCLKRIKVPTVCLEHGEIGRASTVKGYEFAPDQYVVMTEADFGSVPLPTKSAVAIEEFVPEGTPLLFARGHYYMGPDQVGTKAYNLLRDVMRKQKVVAIAKVMIRERETLASISVAGDILLLTTLFWPDEVRDPSEAVGVSDYEPQAAEMKMAASLVKEMTNHFDPAHYRDLYKEALLSIIEARIAGTEPPAMTAPAPVPALDIMAVLTASMEAAKQKGVRS
jgi:DNA end-binding protein Ku